MMHPTAGTTPMITVMTSRDADLVFEVFRHAAEGNRRSLPPGISATEDVLAVMRGGVAFFVAYRGQLRGEARPVGAIGYRLERGTLRIVHVAVKEEARGGGVARRLVQAVEAVGSALGSTAAAATVGRENNYHQLFERFGYQATGDGERLPMTKPLV